MLLGINCSRRLVVGRIYEVLRKEMIKLLLGLVSERKL